MLSGKGRNVRWFLETHEKWRAVSLLSLLASASLRTLRFNLVPVAPQMRTRSVPSGRTSVDTLPWLLQRLHRGGLKRPEIPASKLPECLPQVFRHQQSARNKKQGDARGENDSERQRNRHRDKELSLQGSIHHQGQQPDEGG